MSSSLYFDSSFPPYTHVKFPVHCRPMQERIQKILSGRGVASRRKAEEYIVAGLVKVNGKVASLGQKADPDTDKITVHGKVISDRKEMMYYLMHKPVGVETTNVPKLVIDPKSPTTAKASHQHARQAPSVRDLLPTNLQGKIYPIGRLDKDSSGLLLFTNDGVLAYRLTHPKFDHEKEYEVTVEGDMPPGAMKKLEDGLKIDGKKTKAAKVERIDASHFRIALTEGRYRQIRRMCQKVGNPVKTLTRIRVMTVKDETLKSGKLRELTDEERVALLKSVGIE